MRDPALVTGMMNILPALNVLRQCPLVFLVKVGCREMKALAIVHFCG
jgi:hypothetical protein